MSVVAGMQIKMLSIVIDRIVFMKGEFVVQNLILGYTLAILSSVFHTLYIIPRKLSHQKPKYYTLYMSIGFVISSILICWIYAIKGYELDLNNPLLIYATIAGVLSMVASISLVIAIDNIGMSRSNQWKNFQGPIGALLIFFIFGEASTTKIYFLFFAIIAIFL